MLLSLALALTAPDAHAGSCDGGFGEETLSLELATSGMSADALISGGARLDAGSPYFSVEGRSQASGHWVGRGSVGFDVFEDWEGFDLELGLSMATGGDWHRQVVYGGPGLGFEFGMGVNIGRIHGHYRAITPFSDEPVGQATMERRWRLGFDLLERAQLFGEGIVINEEAGVTEWEKARALGAGVKFTF